MSFRDCVKSDYQLLDEKQITIGSHIVLDDRITYRVVDIVLDVKSEEAYTINTRGLWLRLETVLEPKSKKQIFVSQTDFSRVDLASSLS